MGKDQRGTGAPQGSPLPENAGRELPEREEHRVHGGECEHRKMGDRMRCPTVIGSRAAHV